MANGRRGGQWPRLAAALTLIASALLVSSTSVVAQQTILVAAFAGQTHVHGLAFDPQDPDYLFIATHHGLFRAGPDAMATQISIVQDLMGFAPHPTDPNILFASGHPSGGGNLGFIVSNDGGRTWAQRAPGFSGPVDFHLMAVSPVDPNVIYGTYGGLQRSSDGGRTWSIVGSLPPGPVDLAASAVNVDTLFVATEGGLYVTTDAGVNWRALISDVPVSLANVAPDGSVYAFVLGQGLLRAANEDAEFTALGSSWVEPYLFHLAVDPTNPAHLFAATATGQVVQSVDNGLTWTAFGE